MLALCTTALALNLGTRAPNPLMQVAEAPAPASTATIRSDLAACMGNEPSVGMADEAALAAANTFPIPADELISLAK